MRSQQDLLWLEQISRSLLSELVKCMHLGHWLHANINPEMVFKLPNSISVRRRAQQHLLTERNLIVLAQHVGMETYFLY